MDKTEGSLKCPKCGTQNIEDKNYCPKCGYDFRTRREGAGPVTFAYPEVEFAYEPSGQGNLSGYGWMLFWGLVAGTLGGLILYPLFLAIFIALAYLWAHMGGWMIGLLFLVVIFAGPLLLGYAIGLLIAWAMKGSTVAGKIGNIRGAKVVGMLAGLGSFAVYLLVSYLVFGKTSLQTWYDVLVPIEFLVGIIYGAYKRSGEVIREHPFCESCQERMSTITFENIPIRHEDTLMEMARSSDFGNMAKLATSKLKDEENCCDITVWYCDSCKCDGIINIETTQKRYSYAEDGTKTEFSESRLICSSRVDRLGIEPFIGLQTG